MAFTLASCSAVKELVCAADVVLVSAAEDCELLELTSVLLPELLELFEGDEFVVDACWGEELHAAVIIARIATVDITPARRDVDRI